MKHVLRIRNETHHKNVVSRYKMGQKQRRIPLRLLEEYIQNGQAIQILTRRLAEFKAAGKPEVKGIGLEARPIRQKYSALQNEWKKEHPGFIWKGDDMYAPNGATFITKEIIEKIKAASAPAS